MSNHWFEKYEEARADITAHFRKIMELQKENEKLTNVLEIAESQMSTAVKYLKDDGADKLENTEPEHQMFYGLSYALEQINRIKNDEK